MALGLGPSAPGVADGVGTVSRGFSDATAACSGTGAAPGGGEGMARREDPEPRTAAAGLGRACALLAAGAAVALVLRCDVPTVLRAADLRAEPRLLRDAGCVGAETTGIAEPVSDKPSPLPCIWSAR